MDRLPSEILNKIFIQLELQQRIKCLLVCRNWWNVLDKYSLFYDIHLDESENKDQLDRFMEMFERLPDRAAQIQDVEVVLRVKTQFVFIKLVHVFPNARKTRIRVPFTETPEYKVDPKASLNMKCLKPHIEELHAESTLL